MKVNFTNNIEQSNDIYNRNSGKIEFINNQFYGTIRLAKKGDTLHIEDTGFFVEDIDKILKIVETIFELGCNYHKDITVVETDGTNIYSTEAIKKLYCTVSFTFENDIRVKKFDIFLNK